MSVDSIGSVLVISNSLDIVDFVVFGVVNFLVLMDGYINWNWYFGDGVEANGVFVIYIYDVMGIYIVGLIVIIIEGCINVVICRIVVIDSMFFVFILILDEVFELFLFFNLVKE